MLQVQKLPYILLVQVPHQWPFASSKNHYPEKAVLSWLINPPKTGNPTYITGLNLHDDNMNVIARANLAQPIVKTDSDKMVIKLRIDY